MMATKDTTATNARLLRAAAHALALLFVPSTALAEPGRDLVTHIRDGAIETVIFGLLGIALLLVGYKAFQMIVPWDVNKEIEADHNTAVAIVLAGLFIGVSVIIAAVLVS
jgi:uncharacterized membrane protein YjfL (UPF0719 family)